MPGVSRGIKIDPMIVPGRVETASSAIDIDISTILERGPGVRVVAHYPDCQLIGDPVIDPHADSAGSEVVTLAIAVAVHVDKVTEASHPDTPTIFRCVLKD